MFPRLYRTPLARSIIVPSRQVLSCGVRRNLRAKSVIFAAAAASDQEAIQDAYRKLGLYLKSLGITSAGEVARIADLAMNPNSMFFETNDKKRHGNVHARRLDVDKDVKPVIAYLKEQGAGDRDVTALILAHPAILCYTVENRLEPLFSYLVELGVKNPLATILQRPTLLGIDPQNVSKIVGWLKDNDYSTDQIVEYISTTL